MRVRFRIIRSKDCSLILVPLADEFTIPIIPNYKELMQYTLEGDIEPDKLTISQSWDEEHKKK